MATISATILVGTTHPNHGGIQPTHQLLLSENSRPAYSLVAMHSPQPQSVWIPTVEDMLEDGLLMAGLLVVQDPQLVAAAGAFRRGYAERVEMYEDISEPDRRRLYELCTGLDASIKLVITILNGSSIAGQLAVLNRYKVGVEVCPSVYSREYSTWTNEFQEHGALPGAS